MNGYYPSIFLLPMVHRQADLRRAWCRGRKTITPSQRVWVRYLLMLWGKHLGGDDYDGGCDNVIGRMMIRTEWSEDRAKHIISAVEGLYEQGYRGDELFRRSRQIVIPGTTAADIIALAKETDDAAFVEKVMTKTIRRGSPMHDIAIIRYCERKRPQDIAKVISWRTGCDVQAARKRAIWAEEILEEEMFYGIKREIEQENSLNAE